MGELIGAPAKGSVKLRYFDQVLAMVSKLDTGTLVVNLPDGQSFSIKGEHPGAVADITIQNPEFFARIVRQGVLGFAEGYMDGDWTTTDLQALLDVLYSQIHRFYMTFPGAGLVRAFEKFRFWMQSNSRKQARKNISYHYDLGNDFYSLWLDETMTYSAALFENAQESLEAAQTRKYKSMVDQMGAKPGDHVLEIGCGWGGFAEYAAGQRGLKVTGLTISQEQYDYAVERIRKAGLQDMVEIKLQDYRDETGTYDGIASIEMFEAVGEKYWPVYFNKVHECLKPGANATLQIITIHDDRFAVYRKSVDFIQKYIFPGGMLPSPTVLRQEAVKAGLKVKGSIEFGNGYSQTLRRWHEVFNEKWDRVAQLGFDDRFRRMWNFYLTSCASSFESGNTDLTQITITKQA
jgi:cyclopropane-fatty-acyl-phospholipid synthase